MKILGIQDNTGQVGLGRSVCVGGGGGGQNKGV